MTLRYTRLILAFSAVAVLYVLTGHQPAKADDECDVRTARIIAATRATLKERRKYGIILQSDAADELSVRCGTINKGNIYVDLLYARPFLSNSFYDLAAKASATGLNAPEAAIRKDALKCVEGALRSADTSNEVETGKHSVRCYASSDRNGTTILRIYETLKHPDFTQLIP